MASSPPPRPWASAPESCLWFYGSSVAGSRPVRDPARARTRGAARLPSRSIGRARVFERHQTVMMSFFDPLPSLSSFEQTAASFDRLRALRREGVVGADTLVWTEGMRARTRVEDLPSLLAALDRETAADDDDDDDEKPSAAATRGGERRDLGDDHARAPERAPGRERGAADVAARFGERERESPEPTPPAAAAARRRRRRRRRGGGGRGTRRDVARPGPARTNTATSCPCSTRARPRGATPRRRPRSRGAS